MSDVKLLVRWDGWCDPCECERPLALTEHGRRGLRAWLAGIGPEDRRLVLTCMVCGEGQSVPQLEEDDRPEPMPAPAVPLILTTALQPGRRTIVLAPPPEAATLAASPSTDTTDAELLELLADGLAVVAPKRR